MIVLYRQLAQVVPTVFGALILVFIVMRVLPGDAAVAMLGTTATPDAIVALRANLGLDRPLGAVAELPLGPGAARPRAVPGAPGARSVRCWRMPSPHDPADPRRHAGRHGDRRAARRPGRAQARHLGRLSRQHRGDPRHLGPGRLGRPAAARVQPGVAALPEQRRRLHPAGGAARPGAAVDRDRPAAQRAGRADQPGQRAPGALAGLRPDARAKGSWSGGCSRRTC